jgi:spermidine synthase
MKPLGRQLIAEFIYCSEKILGNKKALDRMLTQGIKESGLTLVSLTGKQFSPAGVTSIALISESHVAIHTYPEAGHASVDIFTCANGTQNVNKLLLFLQSRLKPRTVRIMELDRGNPLSLNNKNWISSFSGTGFEVKYHIKKRLLNKRTRFQQLDIIENESFGTMMFLDKDLQIAEKDAVIYDEAMVMPIVERKRNHGKIAILGGGDGGVLREVLKHDPAAACLIEIDKDVINAAREYMPGVCKQAFDNEKTKIVLDDAFKFLDRELRYDAIVYDLTMHPEAITAMDRTDFLDRIFAKIKKSLNKGGVVSMQCCSEFDLETRKLLKALLPKYFKKIKYQTVFIPSFCENWTFASAEAK